MKQLSESPNEKNIDDSTNNLKMIADEAKRCGDIVKNLLLFSRRRYEEMSEQDIIPIINRSIELAKHSIKTANIKLRHEILTENTRLVCDPTGIQQMVLIFLINAIEAVPEDGGEVTVKLQKSPEASMLRLQVSDNGVGISKEDLSYIFEPFYTTKESAENTGLGLAVAYRIIITRHGGKISVDSKLGEGTTFTIDLPVSGPVKSANDVMEKNINSNQEVS
jgi:two-component system NtrC family sensor kinase